MKSRDQFEQLTDEQLTDCFKATRDNRFLGKLLERYTGLLLGVAMKFLKNKAQSEDAVQQVFVKVIANLPKEEVHNFRGWLYVLMRNHCLQTLRDRHRMVEDTQLQDYGVQAQEEAEYPDPITSPERLHQAISQLPEGQQISVRLFYLEKKSYEEIMAATGYTFMQVKSYIQNGKRNLKSIILKQMNNKAI